MTTQYEMAHRRLHKLLPGLADATIGQTWRLKAEGFMDLVAEVIDADPAAKTPSLTLSLAHYWEQNGDLMADPEMTVKVYLGDWPMADALSFRQDGGVPYVSNSYGEVDGRAVVYPARKKDNNAFLSQWLRNIENQGHKAVDSAVPE